MSSRVAVLRVLWVAVLVVTGLLAVDHALAAAEAPAECSERNSERTTVAAIDADPSKYESHCVAVDGVMQRTMLFANVDGVYLRPRDTLNPATNGLTLGLDHIDRHFSWRYRHVSIVGRVQDCETVRAMVREMDQQNGTVSMVSGYCHYFSGPYVYVRHLQFRPGPPLRRQMEHSGLNDYGDLVPAPTDWPGRARVEALASEFLAALRSSDRNKLIDMHFVDGDPTPDEESALLKLLLRGSDSPFASIRTSRTDPQQIILIHRPQDDLDYSSFVCFCREKSCDGRWPIATFDADNIAARPYACTQVGPFRAGKEFVPFLTTERGLGGLAEP